MSSDAVGCPPVALLCRHRALEMLVHVLDHHDRRVDHRADRDRDAAERHDVRADADHPHRDERDEDPEGQREDRHQGGAGVQQEDDAHQRHDELSSSSLPRRLAIARSIRSLRMRGCQVIAAESGHVVPIDQPSVVVDGIRAIVDAVRKGGDAGFCR